MHSQPALRATSASYVQLPIAATKPDQGVRAVTATVHLLFDTSLAEFNCIDSQQRSIVR